MSVRRASRPSRFDDDRAAGSDRLIWDGDPVEDLEVGAKRGGGRGARDVAAARAVIFDVRVVTLHRVPLAGDVAAVAARGDRRVGQLDADRRRARVLEI